MNAGKFVLHHTKQNKGKATYIYYMIAWYYRKNNKPYRNIIINLGKLTKSEIEYYKNCLACLNRDPDMFPCHIKKITVQHSLEYLSCAVGIHFWNEWNLSTIFPRQTDKKEVSTNDLALILTTLRFVQTCSKTYTTHLYTETTLPALTGVTPALYNRARIFRELETIESFREALGRHIYEQAQTKGYTQGQVVFYDLSSGNFSGLRCVLAKWGHCKDGYTTHVVLLLVTTPEGYPIYWDILEGNTADTQTMAGLITKIEKIYGALESVICFDRGMVSDENLRLLADKNIEFITALDGSQIHYFDDCIDFELIKFIKTLNYKTQSNRIQETLSKSGFSSHPKNLYYYEITISESHRKKIEDKTPKLDVEKRRYFIAFNPELAYVTHKHRKERVEDFKEWVEGYNSELQKAIQSRKRETIEQELKKQIRKRKITDVEISYELESYRVKNKNSKGNLREARTYKIKVDTLTEKAYEKARKYDGLWILITNISQEKEDAFFEKSSFTSYFEIYRLKSVIEESFRILSDFVGIEPFYVYKPEHIKAHFTLCVLSYLIDITILNQVRASEKIENMSLERIFHLLKKCKQDVIQLNEDKTISTITKVNEEQKKVLDALHCTHLISPDYLFTRKIISL